MDKNRSSVWDTSVLCVTTTTTAKNATLNGRPNTDTRLIRFCLQNHPKIQFLKFNHPLSESHQSTEAKASRINGIKQSSDSNTNVFRSWVKTSPWSCSLWFVMGTKRLGPRAATSQASGKILPSWMSSCHLPVLQPWVSLLSLYQLRLKNPPGPQTRSSNWRLASSAATEFSSGRKRLWSSRSLIRNKP